MKRRELLGRMAVIASGSVLMDTLISHKNGKIGTIQVNNILSSEMGDAIIITDQNIKQVMYPQFLVLC